MSSVKERLVCQNEAVATGDEEMDLSEQRRARRVSLFVSV